MREAAAQSWKEGQVKEMVIFSPQHQSVLISWKEGARVDGAWRFSEHSFICKYFLTFFIVKKNKVQKQNNKTTQTKIHSSMIYHKVNSHLTKKYNIARSPHPM